MASLEFTYDGTVKAITAASDCYVDFTIQGGGGGGGGSDSPYSGSAGLTGSIVHGRVQLSYGETLYCAIGAGGKAGATTPGSGSSRGGSGGFGLDGFSGGKGGNAGSSGWSGGGGGGGAATVLYKLVNNARQYIAIAAGGGGGGGGGNNSYGYVKSMTPYGLVDSLPLQYYSPVSLDYAWGWLLRTYGVWNGDGSYYWNFYFPVTQNYTFELSVDNDGAMYIDGNFLVRTGGGEGEKYGNTWTTTALVNAGWHSIQINGSNWGGPAGVAGRILQNGNEIWNSRAPRIGVIATGLNLTRGGSGQNKQGDGGGPGGGGAGSVGGWGGLQPNGDNGAMSGSNGNSALFANSSDGAGEKSSIYSNTGMRGSPGYDGNAGYAGFSSIATGINILSLDKWKSANTVYVMQNSTWTKVQEVYYRQNNEWIKVYGDNIPTYISQSSLFNATSGIMIPL